MQRVGSSDIEVEFNPAAWRQGHDPQLEKAVAVALQDLTDHPAPRIKRPNYPVYNWPAARSAATASTKAAGQN